MKKKIFIVAAVIISSHLLAQSDTSGRILDEVVLTTNKYPKKQSETGKVITIISNEQLEKSSGKTLSEILNTVAGVTIPGANNNYGTNLNINIRGASAGNALILVDGLPLTDPSVNNNYFDLNFLAIDQIDRIEILKGGQSTLYGSDAVAGVVNIITKKAGLKKINVNVSITGGSYNTFKQYIGLNGTCKKLNYVIGYTHFISGGFSAAYDSTGKQNFDKDGFVQQVLNGSLGYRLNKNLETKVFGTFSYYKTDLDAGAFIDEKDYNVKNNNAEAGIGVQYNHIKGSLHFNYFFNYVSRDYLQDSTDIVNPYVIYSKSAYIGRTHFVEMYNNWKWNNWEFLTGIDFHYNNTFQQYFSTGIAGPYTPPVLNNKMIQISPYASLVYKNNKGFNIEMGSRWNYHSVYGNNFTYTLNPSYLINKKVKIFTNLYSAYKVPTLYQLFDPSAGNKNLEPEKGVIGEAGIEIYSSRFFHTRIIGFYRNTKNAILYTYNPLTYASLYMNVSSQENYGSEVEVTYSINKWRFNLNYTYTDGKTKSGYDGTGSPIGKDTTYYNLYRIPKNAINFNAGIQATHNLFISVQLHSVGKREEFIYGSQPETLNAYNTIDVYSEYKLTKKIKLFLSLKNITNKKYFDFLGYNSMRFNFTTGINFSI